MMYHKIRKVPLYVCTAEQKIAYNLAFRYYDTIKNQYNNLPMQFQKSELIHEYISKMIQDYKNSYDYKPNKYNIDAIYSCLNAGLESYINTRHYILSDYEAIGSMFPAIYKGN